MKKLIMIFTLVLSVGLITSMVTGCESADGYSIEITASSYSVGVGEHVYLNASGWNDYTWSLSDNSLGYLNKQNGESVIYTSRASSGKQKITVVARGSGATANTSTNKTDKVSSPLVGTVEITHGTSVSEKNTSTSNSEKAPDPTDPSNSSEK